MQWVVHLNLKAQGTIMKDENTDTDTMRPNHFDPVCRPLTLSHTLRKRPVAKAEVGADLPLKPSQMWGRKLAVNTFGYKKRNLLCWCPKLS